MSSPHRFWRGIGPVLLFGVLAGGLLALPALAPAEEAAAIAPTPDSEPLPPSDPEALSLLRRAASVGVAKSYSGSELVAVAGSEPSTSIVEVEHKALVGTEMRVVSGAEPLASPAFDPDDPALVGASPVSSPLAAIAEGDQWATLVADTYVTQLAGSDQVAGDNCDVLQLTRANGTLAARLCISQATGLILDRRIFDQHGSLMRYSTYSKVGLVSDETVGNVSSDMHAAAVPPAGTSTPLSAAQLAKLRAGGAVIPATLSGSLSLVDSRTYLGTSTSASTLQLTYSDGLSSLSLTEQPGRLSARLPAGWVSATVSGSVVEEQRGLPERLAWADRGTVFTVVSDTDEATLTEALSELPRVAADTSYGRRMRRGIDRVGSWLDPTH